MASLLKSLPSTPQTAPELRRLFFATLSLKLPSSTTTKLQLSKQTSDNARETNTNIIINLSFWLLPSLVLKRMVMGNFPNQIVDAKIADSIDFMVDRVNISQQVLFSPNYKFLSSRACASKSWRHA